MVIYFVILVILFIFSTNGAKNFTMLVAILAMSVVLGFRSITVGMDTMPYIKYYQYDLDVWESHMEFGWNALCIFFKHMEISPYGYNFIVAVLTLIPYFIVAAGFKDRRLNGYILFLLYSLGFYLLMFNGMRQFLAMSLILLGYKFLEEKKIIWYLFFVLLATTIHTSSYIALALLLLYRINLNTNRLVIALAVTFIIGIFTKESFFLFFASKYSHDIYDFGFRNSLAYTFVVGLLTNVFTVYLYVNNKTLQNNYWIKLNVVSVMVLNLLSNLVIGPRIVYIFSITSVIALSLYMRHSTKQVVYLTYLYAIVTFGRFIVPEIQSNGVEGSLVPYSMTFQFFE